MHSTRQCLLCPNAADDTNLFITITNYIELFLSYVRRLERNLQWARIDKRRQDGIEARSNELKLNKFQIALLCDRPIGRIARLARPSVRLSTRNS